MPETSNIVIDIRMRGRKNSNGELDEAAIALKKNSRKPKGSKFSQQELPACKPILTPGDCIIHYSWCYLPSSWPRIFVCITKCNVVEIVDRYDRDCLPSNYSNTPLQFIQSSKLDKTCTRTLTVPKPMKSPVYVYYQLDNFFQNHRRYVRSRSDKQLKSRQSEGVVSTCKPEDSDNGKPIVPCGLVAWSLFNDTYSFTVQNKAVQVNKKDIAWKSDKQSKFGSDVFPKNFQADGLIGGGTLNSSIPLSEQEDLIVWMRTAALPTFRKLYGRIETDLEANDVIEVQIQNNYNSYGYGGKKKLVLSTTTWIGGRNDFLGVAYLFIGGLNLLLAMFFILVYVFKPRPSGDPSYLSWNKHTTKSTN
ncbi:putative ALA-interacting subunit 4 isoform X2 [Mercurialis annua]|uniref:putative ALA-interacting subunit 4 isoform X2 n=1 Tax=Mercurialis annua TaxID=3986 RepID=UPI00215EC4AA|nr:putative ALA-interacting subunit 4 isoform X2 [Mercurialis annua]